MGFSSILLLLLLSFLSISAASPQDEPLLLPSVEQEAAYLALESINSAINWRSLYPDDLCLSGPHGVVCDFFPDETGVSFPHIAELNFGYVSDFSSNPPCSPNSTLTPLLFSSFPFLRKLFFYDCFSYDNTPIQGHFWNFSSSLEELVFLENPSLVGRLRLGNLPRLRRLVLSGSGISGNIPPEIGNLQNLEQLVLSRNRLRGEIPATLGRCGRLKVLDLSGNRLGGSLPVEFGRLRELVKLDLSWNQIGGSVPDELARLSRVEFLDLSYNRFTGGVPTAMAEMVSLREVYLSGNELGGRIPEIWEKLGGILGLGMSGLGLVGNIPRSMGVFLENVCYLAMDGNLLDGELPEQFKRLERTASEINLENNALQGRIPFSAAFVARIGGKLKLAGNPRLCVGGDLVGPTGERGSLGYLGLCNKTEIPHPVLFSSGVSFVKKHLLLMIFFSVLVCLF